jgi:hypothetical protein
MRWPARGTAAAGNLSKEAAASPKPNANAKMKVPQIFCLTAQLSILDLRSSTPSAVELN